jgi:hypothetical protein
VTQDGDDRLRLDYDPTTQLLRMLTDIRFKLIAFVPTIAAASVGLFGKPRPGRAARHRIARADGDSRDPRPVHAATDEPS